MLSYKWQHPHPYGKPVSFQKYPHRALICILYLICYSCVQYPTPLHKPYNATLRWDTPDRHWPACVIMIVADALAPHWCQGISNHHADSTLIITLYELYCAIRIMLQPLNKLVWGRSGGCQPVSFFVIGRLVFSCSMSVCWYLGYPSSPATYRMAIGFKTLISATLFEEYQLCPVLIWERKVILTARYLTHWPLGNLNEILANQFFKLILLMAKVSYTLSC